MLQHQFLLILGFWIAARAAPADPCQKGDPDSCWISYLENPPQDAVQLGQHLSKRADAVAASLPTTLQIIGDIDVAVSGGGNYDAYWMGASMVFSRVKALHMHRFSGASAGGMMPFEQLLKGENVTLMTHLSYGVLTGEYPLHFSSLTAAAEQDHHWRLMAAWQTKKYVDRLSALNDRVFLALSCLDPILPKLTLVSKFTADHDQATHAFMGTGTTLEMYDGRICSDGGATSGPNMTPLFQDHVRPQIIVNLMKTGYPSEMVFKVETEQYANLIRMGQDEATEFLKTGKVSRNSDAITLCPTESTVDNNICEPSHGIVV